MIEGWLEVEAGVDALHGDGGTELGLDLLAKRPIRLAPRASIMIGVGPQIVRAGGATRVGVEAAVDVMWWAFGDHAGIGLEPSYGVTFGPTAQSVGIVVGPIFGW